MSVTRQFNEVRLRYDEVGQVINVKVVKAIRVEVSPSEVYFEPRNADYLRDSFQGAELTVLDDILPNAVVPMLNRESPITP